MEDMRTGEIRTVCDMIEKSQPPVYDGTFGKGDPMHWNMEHWIFMEPTMEGSCGMSGCFVGQAALHSLRLEIVNDEVRVLGGNGGCINGEAFTKVFNIPWALSSLITNPGNYAQRYNDGKLIPISLDRVLERVRGLCDWWDAGNRPGDQAFGHQAFEMVKLLPLELEVRKECLEENLSLLAQ